MTFEGCGLKAALSSQWTIKTLLNYSHFIIWFQLQHQIALKCWWKFNKTEQRCTWHCWNWKHLLNKTSTLIKILFTCHFHLEEFDKFAMMSQTNVPVMLQWDTSAKSFRLYHGHSVSPTKIQQGFNETIWDSGQNHDMLLILQTNMTLVKLLLRFL